MSGLNLNVLVVDDHKMVCEAIAALVEKTGLTNSVINAVNAQQAIDAIASKRIHAALIDARMPEVSGIELASLILKKHSAIKVIGMTSFDEDDTIVEMLQIGINGILLKRNTDTREIGQCLWEVHSGRNYFTAVVASKLSRNEYDLKQTRVKFTRRESEILVLLCKGLSTKLIAAHLRLKESTVEDYRKEMLNKTLSKNTAELIALALRNGIL